MKIKWRTDDPNDFSLEWLCSLIFIFIVCCALIFIFGG